MELTRKAKGDLAELRIALDLVSRGDKVALPFGEDWDYDLILCRGATLERIQVKYATSDGVIAPVRCSSNSLTNGKVMKVKRYTAETIDWLAVYDQTTDACFYVPAAVLGDGMRTLSLLLQPTRNRQVRGIRPAADNTEI